MSLLLFAFSITVALMTLPNLIGILLLHKEVKKSIRQYTQKLKRR